MTPKAFNKIFDHTLLKPPATEADLKVICDLAMTYGFKTVAMALTDNSVSIDDERLAAEEKLAIVLGTEGDGLAHITIADCDYTAKIPMYHGVDSLNVASAGAVAFYALRRK